MDAETLFHSNIRYAYAKANRWYGLISRIRTKREIEQLCLIGLFQASNSYDEQRGPFIGLARMCIDNAVRMDIRDYKKLKHEAFIDADWASKPYDLINQWIDLMGVET